MSSNSLALKGRSDAYTQVDNFLHAYARGGDELVNGHPSYTVDQAAEQILREQASWQKAPGDSVLTLSYSFLTKPNDFFNTPWKYVSDIYCWASSAPSPRSSRPRPSCRCNPGRTSPISTSSTPARAIRAT